MKELMPGLWQFGMDAPDGHSGAIYLVGEGKEMALVDCGTAHNYPLLKRRLADIDVQPQDIGAVYITHGHSDHHEGGVPLRLESNAEIYVGEGDRRAVETGDYWGTAGFFYGRRTLALPETMPIGNGYETRLGGVTLRAIETPGHSPGSITYELDIPAARARVALAGDTAWGGWHESIGSDLSAWKDSGGVLLERNYTHVSFGHGVDRLIAARPHLEVLYEQIGNYRNAYDDIPAEYFDESNALPTYDIEQLAA